MALTDAGEGAFPAQTTPGAPAHRRRYDLDWLRVIAFGLLIFYHVGMFYVTWGWHVKSAYASPAAEPLMMLLNPWRLALLFFISGVALRFASDKLGAVRFAGERAWRLGVPIVFGMVVVVAPQSYFELRQAGAIEPGYLAFWREYLALEQTFSMITPTWNHLWYVVYLLVYALLLAPFLPLLRRFADGAGGRAFAWLTGGPVRLLLVVTLPFILYRFTLDPVFPETHALFGDWANHAHCFTILMIGYFAAKNDRFWSAVDRTLPWALGVSVTLGVGLSVAWANWEAVSATAALNPLRVLRIVYAWSVIVALLGLAQRFLNRPSPALTYLTGAVFPYYILHQTIIVAAGYYLTQLHLGVGVEFALVMTATVGGCALLHEFVIRRVVPLRPLFGMKVRAPDQEQGHEARRVTTGG